MHNDPLTAAAAMLPLPQTAANYQFESATTTPIPKKGSKPPKKRRKIKVNIKNNNIS